MPRHPPPPPPVMPIRPSVRVVRGLVVRSTWVATSALQAAMKQRLGKHDQGLVQQIGVFPVPGRSVAIVGESIGHAPLIFSELRQVDPSSPYSQNFPAAQTGVGRGSEVGEDDELLSECIQDVLPGLGVDLSPGTDGELVLGRDHGFQTVLLSDDGRDGMLVYGYSRWRGPDCAGGRVATWSFDLGNDEAMRLTGVPFCQVGGGTNVRLLEEGLDGDAHEAARAEARRETLALYDSATEPFGWHVVDTSTGGPRGP